MRGQQISRRTLLVGGAGMAAVAALQGRAGAHHGKGSHKVKPSPTPSPTATSPAGTIVGFDNPVVVRGGGYVTGLSVA